MAKPIHDMTDDELLAALREGHELDFDLNLIIAGIPSI